MATETETLGEGSIHPAVLPPPSSSILPTELPSVTTIACTWLGSLSKLIASNAITLSALDNLFLENSYWRDHLCLSWDFRTFHGPTKINEFFKNNPDGVRIKSVSIDNSVESSITVVPLDSVGNVRSLQISLIVGTDVGSGRGLARLFKDGGGRWKAYTLYTALHELKGYEEAIGPRRPHGVDHGARKSRQSWKDRRDAEIEFENEEPTVLVVGAGQGGLTIGARLKMLGVQTLIIDKNERVGDNWRKRYHQLVLHDRVFYDHLPYLPFPSSFPIYIPKDKLADWFESYAKTMELNVWTATTITSTTWDPSTSRWTVTLLRTTPSGTTTRVLHSRHIVMATGHAGEPNLPNIRGISDFTGDRICHSSQFTGAKIPSTGKKVVIVGCCNSAHDIAQDYYEQGAQVTIVQRSSTNVVSSEHGMDEMIGGDFYEGGPPAEDADMMMYGTTMPVLKRLHQDKTKKIASLDSNLLSGLARAGFKLDPGPHGAGFIMKYFERGGGYYIDVGASQLIIDGKIKIKQGQEITQILPHGIAFADGTTLDADEIILATGYDNMRSTAVKVFGKELGDKVKPVWGFDEEGEIQTMWRRSGHDGFWFMGGNLGFARYFSRLLAIQIKAIEEGLAAYDKV